jgi:plexin A
MVLNCIVFPFQNVLKAFSLSVAPMATPHTALAAATLLLALASMSAPALAQDVVGYFSDEFSWNDNEIPQFANLVVNKVTGFVYVGAVNKLYQLSPDLKLTVSAVTGPKEDSPFCSVLPDCPHSHEKKLTNNVNKALVVDYAESRLIECGSLFQVFHIGSLWPFQLWAKHFPHTRYNL